MARTGLLLLAVLLGTAWADGGGGVGGEGVACDREDGCDDEGPRETETERELRILQVQTFTNATLPTPPHCTPRWTAG